MLHILNQPDFLTSLSELVQAVSFNPKVPENMIWCVSDHRSEYGAIKYKHILNAFTKTSTKCVVKKKLQNILFNTTAILKIIKMTTVFNYQQYQNYLEYIALTDKNHIDKIYIKCVKMCAYNNRLLCKTLWEHLNISLYERE